MSFKVSVIIPVYNAENYVGAAIESAVGLSEVGEVILVEDASPDSALEVCQKLENQYEKVKLFQHPNGENKGAGISRNLGIKNAICEYIAFLDADDIYKDNRFKKDAEIFSSDPEIEGVYNASSYMIDSDYAFTQVKRRFKTNDPKNFLNSVREEIHSSDLFYYLLNGGKGHFNTPGITLKKNVFTKVGYFNELRLHQDNHMWLRIAAKCTLKAGEINESVALIRVHENNRIKNVNRDSRVKYYQTLHDDLIDQVKGKRNKTTLIKKLISAKTYHIKNKTKRLGLIAFYLISYFFNRPKMISQFSLKYFIK